MRILPKTGNLVFGKLKLVRICMSVYTHREEEAVHLQEVRSVWEISAVLCRRLLLGGSAK